MRKIGKRENLWEKRGLFLLFSLFSSPRFIGTIFKAVKKFLDEMKFDAKLFIYLSRSLRIILVNMIIFFMRPEYLLQGLTYFSRILFLSSLNLLRRAQGFTDESLKNVVCTISYFVQLILGSRIFFRLWITLAKIPRVIKLLWW